MKELLRKYISHWAMLPVSQFGDDDSLKALRPDFGFVSKMAMIADAMYNNEGFVDEYDMPALDTVNDFVRYFDKKKLKIRNEAPEGYK